MTFVCRALGLIVCMCTVLSTAQPTPDRSQVVALRQCVPEIKRLCAASLTTPPDVLALAECLQSHLNNVTPECQAALEPFIQQAGEDGDLDRVVADEETSESSSEVEAEDEICDAKAFQVCRSQVFVAVFSGNPAPLQDCARQHAASLGQACAAIIQNAQADGLLRHMKRCGTKTLQVCPVQALALSAEAMLGLDTVEAATVAALVACLREQFSAVSEGCAGFVDSVSDVISQLSDRVSDQFKEEEQIREDSSKPAHGPDTTQPPAPPSPSDSGSRRPSDSKASGGDTSAGEHDSPSSAPNTIGGSSDESQASFLLPGLLIGFGAFSVLVAGAAGGFFYWRRHRNTSELMHMMGLSQSEGPSQIADVGFSHERSTSEYSKVEMA